MRILFLVLVAIFQGLGCLSIVQQLVSMVMATGYFHNAQTVFICLALSIIVFAALVKFVPSIAKPFQAIEDKVKALASRQPSANPANELTAQVQSLAADVALIKSLIVPAQGVTQNPANLDALATGQAPAAGASQ